MQDTNETTHFIACAERFASFYRGVAEALSADQEDDLDFLATAFDKALQIGPNCVEYGAIAALAGVEIGGDGPPFEVLPAMARLLRRMGKARLTEAQINALCISEDEEVRKLCQGMKIDIDGGAR